MPYAKIFDATNPTRWIAPDRIGPIAATSRLYSRMGLGPVGPLAIIIDGQRATERAEDTWHSRTRCDWCAPLAT